MPTVTRQRIIYVILFISFAGLLIVKQRKLERYVCPHADQISVQKQFEVPNPATNYPYEAIQAERKALLQKRCNLRNETTLRNDPKMTSFYSHALVNDEHRVLYCHVPKAATSSWKYVFLLMGNVTVPQGSNKSRVAYKKVHYANAMKEASLNRLKVYTEEERDHRLKNYFKFVIVRHPLDRLASAYYDKFKYPQELTLRNRLAKIIITNYRPFPPEVPDVDDVHFQEFSEYVLAQARSDEHWQTYQTLCEPCAVDYDYIGHVDTMAYDVPYILSRIHADSYIDNFPNLHAFKVNSTYYQKLFGNITLQTFHKLLDRYSEDMSMFNYTWLDYLQQIVT